MRPIHPKTLPTPWPAALAAISITVCIVGGCSMKLAAPGWFRLTPDSPAEQPGLFVAYEEAVSRSNETGKPLLLLFTGSDWCTWCMRLDEEVFQTPEFEQWATDHVVMVEVDFPQSDTMPGDQKVLNETLKQQYDDHISGFPTVVFVTPDGDVIGKLGYEKGGAKAWTRKAEELLATTAG